MSNDRYRFERRIEKAKGGGLQGLDIEIYDVYLIVIELLIHYQEENYF